MIDRELAEADLLARRFREAIKASSLDAWVSLQDFPHGACSDASLLLAKFFSENSLDGFLCVAGSRGGSTHAWLRRDDLIVDITGDQFEDMDEPVLATRRSPWHDTFVIDEVRPAVIEHYDKRTQQYLLSAYARITGELRDGQS